MYSADSLWFCCWNIFTYVLKVCHQITTYVATYLKKKIMKFPEKPEEFLKCQMKAQIENSSTFTHILLLNV